MPLYEYECQQCEHRFEKIQSFSAAPETVCPKCGGVLEKLISRSAIQFKGAGWYVSDYSAKGAASKKASAADSNGGGSTATAVAGSDSSAATTATTTKTESKNGGDSSASKPATSAAPTTPSSTKTS